MTAVGDAPTAVFRLQPVGSCCKDTQWPRLLATSSFKRLVHLATPIFKKQTSQPRPHLKDQFIQPRPHLKGFAHLIAKVFPLLPHFIIKLPFLVINTFRRLFALHILQSHIYIYIHTYAIHISKIQVSESLLHPIARHINLIISILKISFSSGIRRYFISSLYSCKFQTLVKIGDKPKTFLNSKQWIGSTEVCYVLDELLSVSDTLSPVSICQFRR